MPTGPLTWIGLAVALVAAVVLAGGLIGDRARGRRRCPRCWYDLAGTGGLTCPECGRTAESERALGRTRRWWGRAGLGLAGIAVGAGLAWGQVVAACGWRGATPTAVLVVGWPWLPADWRLEVDRRLARDELRQWGIDRLVDACMAVIEADTDPAEVDAALRVLIGVASAEQRTRRFETLRDQQVELRLTHEQVRRLGGLLVRPEGALANWAMTVLMMMDVDARPAVTHLVLALADDRRPIRHAALRIVASVWPHCPLIDFVTSGRPRERGVSRGIVLNQLLPVGLPSPDEQIRPLPPERVAALRSLVDRSGDPEALAERCLELTEDADPVLRLVGAWLLGVLRPGEPQPAAAYRAARSVLEGPDPDLWLPARRLMEDP